MKYVTIMILALAGLKGQTQVSAVTGTAPIVTYSFGGSQLQTGLTTPLYYAVVANFVGGSIQSSIVQVRNGPMTLSANSFISFQWGPVAGATSYDLLRLSGPSIPSGASSIGLHTGLTSTASTDTGTSTSSYTLAAAPPVPVSPFIYYQSRDYNPPKLYVEGVGALGPSTSTTPGGSNTQVQFNDNGAFGGSAGFTFDKTTGNVAIGTTVLNVTSGVIVPLAVNATSPVSPAATGFYLNNTAGAITYNLPAITSANVGLQMCFRNAVTRTGSITLTAPASTYIDVAGANGSAAGTLVSGGALGDAVCVVAVNTTQYMAYTGSGVWTNN